MSSAELTRLLAALWKHKWWVAGATVIGLAISHFYTERLPRLYQASCSIEYDTNPMRPLGNAFEDSSPYAAYWSIRDIAETQNRIIASRVVAEKVVRKLGLHQNPAFFYVPAEQRASWKPATVTEAAQALQGRLRVSPERDTQIVHVQVSDRDPERAAMLANAVTDAYIEKTLEDRLGSSTSALEWLGKQLDALKSELERSELSLHEFVEDQAALSMPLTEQQNLISADIQRLNSKLGEVRMLRIELAAHLDSLRAANREDPLAVTHPDLVGSAAAQSVRLGYFTVEAQRRALAVKYGDEHPQIRALDAQLANGRENLRLEIDGTIAAVEAKLAEVRTIEAGVRGALDAANAQGLELSLHEITYRRLERERDNAARLYGTILERTADTDLTRALEVSFVRVIDRALTPGGAIYPNVRRNMTVGAFLGLLGGLAIAFLLSQLDRVVRTVEAAEALGLTVLGVLPNIEQSTTGPGSERRRRKSASVDLESRDLFVHTHPKSSVAECCRTIRTNLMFMGAEHAQRTLVLTSASPREGKTTVTISLAIALAQSGKRVLLVDTDLRRPRAHKAFGRPNARGVTTVLVGEGNVKDVVQTTQVPGLDLLASGPIPPNPSELLHMAAFRRLLEELQATYDHVLLDSPPLMAVTDAAVLASQVDGVILVLHGQKTTRDAASSALRQLRDVSANIVGSVLNDVDLHARQYGYGSYYYYRTEGYYEEPAPAPERVAAAEE